MQEAEIPFISMASSSEIVEPVAERYWVFKTPQSNRHTAPWQVRYVKDKGIDKVASLYVNDAYGEDGRNAIRQAAEEAGVEIVLEETFEASDTDMTAQLTKIKASDAEALLVTGLPPAASILTKQFRELGLDMPLVHNHGIGMKPFIDLAGAENAEGVVFPIGKLVAVDALDDSDPQKAVLQQFIEDYEAYTGNPASTFAGHAWDGMQIALQAIETMPAGLSLGGAASLHPRCRREYGVCRHRRCLPLLARGSCGSEPRRCGHRAYRRWRVAVLPAGRCGRSVE